MAGDDRGSYRLSARLIGLARAAEAAESIIDVADPGSARAGRADRRDCHPGPADRPVGGVRAPGRVRPAAAHLIRAGPAAPLDRGASARLLLAGLPAEVRGEYLGPLAERDPGAVAQLEERILIAGQQGYAVCEEEIQGGVWAGSARVMQGKRTAAVLTVPSPLVRPPPRYGRTADAGPHLGPSHRGRAACGPEVSRGLKCKARGLRGSQFHRYSSRMPDLPDVIPGTQVSASQPSLAGCRPRWPRAP